jgi:hypothetical protein
MHEFRGADVGKRRQTIRDGMAINTARIQPAWNVEESFVANLDATQNALTSVTHINPPWTLTN